VQPDPAWVAANIRTETVPILGNVTGHKVMLPQLRGALQEVVNRGLADEINPEEYAGCFVPRFIERDPSRGLSLHTWGIAVDLNVPGNLRGTVGEIDRTVWRSSRSGALPGGRLELHGLHALRACGLDGVPLAQSTLELIGSHNRTSSSMLETGARRRASAVAPSSKTDDRNVATSRVSARATPT